jgi:hypothetical protein
MKTKQKLGEVPLELATLEQIARHLKIRKLDFVFVAEDLDGEKTFWFGVPNVLKGISITGDIMQVLIENLQNTRKNAHNLIKQLNNLQDNIQQITDNNE